MNGTEYLNLKQPKKKNQQQQQQNQERRTVPVCMNTERKQQKKQKNKREGEIKKTHGIKQHKNFQLTRMQYNQQNDIPH